MAYGKTALIDDLAYRLAGQNVTKDTIRQVLNETFDLIAEKLQRGEAVQITGFGSWATTRRAARRGRHIRTGAVLEIPARRAVRFRAGSELLAALRGRRARAVAVAAPSAPARPGRRMREASAGT